MRFAYFFSLLFRLPFALLWMLALGGDVSAQSRKLDLPERPFEYAKLDVPAADWEVLKRFDNTPDSNPITNHGATLGRVLFYDPTLSASGTTSCATCHQQQHAFTDPEKLSVGFEGKPVPRNSMSLVNVRFYPGGRMFWDERADTLERQVLMPIENEIEMGHDLEKLVAQLEKDALYGPLFRNAFGDPRVTEDRIAAALAQFVRSIVSFGSKYDIGRRQVKNVLQPFPNFTDQENYGKEQFFGRANCASCHLDDATLPLTSAEYQGYVTSFDGQDLLFYPRAPAVNGIDSDVPDVDKGVADHTEKKSDLGRFKVPSLRNIELTAPFMHDGRFRTLDEVIEHYNWSVRPHPNLDVRLADFAANGMALPETEKVALAKFLLTLTDKNLLVDPKFSDPFVVSTSQSN